MNISPDSGSPLAALRRRIGRIGPPSGKCHAAAFKTGHAGLDGALQDGLARGAVHELFAADQDAPCAAGFAAMLALRAGGAGTVLWLRTEAVERRCGQLHMPGFAELGGDPARLVLALLPDERSLLKAAGDAAACAGLAALVVECRGCMPLLDLTASRRLALMAEKSGVPLFLLRIDAQPVPSAAWTRWQVAAAASTALAAQAPGPITLELELLRRRAGPSGMRWRVEWNRDRHAFQEPPLSGAVVSLSQRGPADAESRLALRRTA